MTLSLDTTIGAGGAIIAEANASSATTASFSTAAAVRLVALAASNGGGTSAQNLLSVSGAGLTWSAEVLSNEPAGTSVIEGNAVIYIAYSAAPLSSVTVTATQTGDPANGTSLTVVGVLGAEVTHGGQENTAAAESGQPQATLTTSRAGSYVFATGSDWSAAGDYAVGAGQSPAGTLLNTHNPGGYSAGQWQTTGTVSDATLVTMQATIATREYHMAIIEIRDALGGGGGSSFTGPYAPRDTVPAEFVGRYPKPPRTT